MLRQKWGSLVCPSCGTLVGVNDPSCLTCGRWNPGMWGFGPLFTRLGRDMGFIPFVMSACIILFGATMIADTSGMRLGGGFFSFLSPSTASLFLFGASGSVPVFGYGRWWTVLTAGWLHGGLLHIGFNLMSLRNVGEPVAEFYGANRMVIIYTFAGITGFAASTLAGEYLRFLPILRGGQLTVGASASICGLIGSLFYYGRRAGSSGVSDQAKQWAIMILNSGFLFPVIDTWAHVGGFVGGYLCSKFLDPLRPERMDHFLGAIACIALTGIALAMSIFYGWPVFQEAVGGR
jgi:rhomboid protease GluP